MARTNPPGIDPVPTPPIQRGDRATFSSRVDAFILWLVNAVAQFRAVALNVYDNAVDAFQSATSASTSATNAGTSATNAANSATSASTSASTATAASTTAQNYALALTATSTTSLPIGTGSKTFAGSGLQSKQFSVGQLLYAVNPSNAAQWMSGTVSAYTSNGASSSLTLNVTDVNPATNGQTVANWSISISGVKGVAGATGGINGGNLTGALNEKRADNDVASSASPDIWGGNGNYVGVTGTATITGFTAAPQAGAERRLLVNGTPTITAGTNLIIKGVPSGSSLPLSPGDEVIVKAESSTRFRVDILRGDGSAVAGSAYFQAQDLRASGTGAGTQATSQEVTRVVTTVVTNNIVGASLSANKITLPAGTYDIQCSAPALNIPQHKLSLWNVTDGVRSLVGSSSGTNNTVTNYAMCSGRVSISTPKDFELRHYLGGAQNTANNLGAPVSQPGVPEIYSAVEIRKVN